MDISVDNLISGNTLHLLELPASVIPNIVISVAILLIGWIVGSLLKHVLCSVFRALPFFDESLRNMGLEKITKRAGIRVNLGEFFGGIAKVFVIFIALVASLDFLGLKSVSEFFANEVLGYIPNVFSAALIIVIGLIAANFVSKLVAGSSQAAKVSGGVAAKVTQWAIVVFSALIALNELGVANEIIQSMVVGIIAAISLALGLAFGLGGQQAASDFLNRVRGDIEKS